MDLHLNLDEHYLWASVFWSAIAGGYWLYGWRQKSFIPLIGGAVMMAACLLSALWMTVVCLAAMYAVWWYMKQGY